MVNYNPKLWLGIIFHAYSRHVMRTLWPALGFMIGFSTLCCYFILNVFRLHEKDFHSTISMHSLLGIVLGLFLVFRTNTAYERWWEGRKLWGGLVNSARNFSLKLNAYLNKDDREERVWFARMTSNFVFAMKEHLRAGVKFSELDMTPEEIHLLSEVKHKPNKLAAWLYMKVNDLHTKGRISGDHLITLDKELKDFIDLIGACERIKNTPIPYSYTMYIKKFIFIYLITLPFGFVTTSGYMTVPIVALISFVLLSVELIAEEIEDPFGLDVNDLPADELAAKIKENVKEILL